MSEKTSSKKILVAITVFAVIAAVVAGIFALTSNNETSSSQDDLSNRNGNSSSTWVADCEGDEKTSMTHMPMDMDDVQNIVPVGLTIGAHVTPIDHLYFFPKDMNNRDAAPVYAMADGYIVDISKREVNVDKGTQRPAEYRIAIQHSCQTVSYFDLMTSLSDDIMKEYNSKGDGTYHIKVKAGQEVGRVGAQSLDTAIYNFSMTLPGFISPEKYDAEFWKIHTDDFFSYFDGDNLNQMLEKNIRKVEPLSGKIDYDQPGKLIGNWFREGTDYAGDGSRASTDGKHGYWSGHLAILYFVGDPSIVIVSLGEFDDGSPRGFAVKGNAPDPADVDTSSGVVAYELTKEPGITPTGVSHSSDEVLGTVLFQVLDGEKLKVEVFPGKTKDQVTGFTSAAQKYER